MQTLSALYGIGRSVPRVENNPGLELANAFGVFLSVLLNAFGVFLSALLNAFGVSQRNC
jgi:hypothetical protein